MAEAAGLALGAVALASLFQTCVEFLEYFEVARNLSEDGELGSTKLNLLEMRLRNWGCEVKVLDPGREDGGWHTALAVEGGIIGRCLAGISDILGDASKLRNKYGLDKRKRLDWSSCFPFRFRPPQQTKTNLFSGTVSLRRHVVWAVRDKKRFDSLIQDLDFFITNLEKVGSHIAKPNTETDLVVCGSHDDTMSQTQTVPIQGYHLGSGRPAGSAPVQGSQHRNGQPAPTSSQHNDAFVGAVVRQNEFNGQAAYGRSSQQAPVRQPEIQGDRSKFRNQQNSNSYQHVGNIGGVAAQSEFVGQVVKDQGCQQVGNSTEAFALQFFQMAKK